MGRELKKNRELFLILLPALAFFIVFNYLPMFGIVLAFKDFKYNLGIFGSPWAGFKNFTFLFATGDAKRIVLNTIGYNGVFIILGTIVSLLLAIGVSELIQQRAAKLFQGIFILPHFISWVVISYLLEGFLSADRGIINRFITGVLGGEPIYWYSDYHPWRIILPLMNLFKHAGYSSIIYYASIVGIDNALYEAAIIDGAGKWVQIRRITLPMIKPIIIILLILAVGRIFNADFGLFYTVTKNSGALYPATMVIDTYVYNALIQLGNIGMSAAAGLFQSVIGFILVLSTNLTVRKVDRELSLF